MPAKNLKIAFVRRGYSRSGGAEAYLTRLATALGARGCEASLYSSVDWPRDAWPFGELTPIDGSSPLKFADALERHQPRRTHDVVVSLERVRECDIYRAGDGVHRAWLDRRARFTSRLRRLGSSLNGKHLEILRLEQALLGRGGAGRVIANSEMVKNEIVQLYGYPQARIEVIRNGLPVEHFAPSAERRRASRTSMGIQPDEVAVLFVGSGWERKGLRYAAAAVEACDDRRIRLFVAGEGNQARFRSPRISFLGVRHDLPALYGAADIFLLPTMYDPFSNASLEALASGLPVITTRANGFSELMRPGIDGTIVDAPDDIGALQVALEFWTAIDREEGAASRIDRARELDISHHVEKTLALIVQAASAESTSG